MQLLMATNYLYIDLRKHYYCKRPLFVAIPKSRTSKHFFLVVAYSASAVLVHAGGEH